MTIERLGKCKTLDDFNEFSKNVQTDMNSGGRSFIYKNPNGDNLSYSMNQIVRQFDKCIKKSEETAADGLSDKINEGLKLITKWNAEADDRDNTWLLSIRQWLGNGWYSMTHSGFNKDETLEAIKAKPEIKKIEDENDALIAEYGIFGKKQWEELGVTIGNVPPLPEGIKEIMESPCPIWADKKVSETHRLVLMPKRVNGEPLTLNSFGQIAKDKAFPNKENGCFRIIHRPIVTVLGDTPIDQSYWVLMTKQSIPESLSKEFSVQKSCVETLSVKSSNEYQVPRMLEVLVVVLTQYFEDNTYLFPHTYSTRCQEREQLGAAFPVQVGCFTEDGLLVTYDGENHNHGGVAARRTF